MASCAVSVIGFVIAGIVSIALLVVGIILAQQSATAAAACRQEHFGITGMDPAAPTNTVQLNQPFSAVPLQAGYPVPNICGPPSMIPTAMQSGMNIPWYGGWRTPVPNLAGILREDDWEYKMYGVLRNRSTPIQDANPASAAGVAWGGNRQPAAVDAAPFAGQVNLQYHLQDGGLSTPAIAPCNTTNSGPDLAALMAQGGALPGDREGYAPGRDHQPPADQQAVQRIVQDHQTPEEKLKKAYHNLPAPNMAQGVLDRAQTKALVTMVSRRSTYGMQPQVRKDQLACSDWLRGDLQPAVENTWNVFKLLNCDRDRDLSKGALGVMAAPGGPWCSTAVIPENMAVCHIDDHCGNNDTGGGGGRGASHVSPISP